MVNQIQFSRSISAASIVGSLLSFAYFSMNFLAFRNNHNRLPPCLLIKESFFSRKSLFNHFISASLHLIPSTSLHDFNFAGNRFFTDFACERTAIVETLIYTQWVTFLANHQYFLLPSRNILMNWRWPRGINHFTRRTKLCFHSLVPFNLRNEWMHSISLSSLAGSSNLTTARVQ